MIEIIEMKETATVIETDPKTTTKLAPKAKMTPVATATAPKKMDLFDRMRKSIVKKNADVILDLTEPKIWAHSGNYVLNHILSGRFSRGYPAGRITQIFGDSGCLLPDEKIKVYQFKSKIDKLTDTEKLLELKSGDGLSNSDSFASINSEKLNIFFNNHVQENSKFEKIKDVYDLWDNGNVSFMVDTPDGFQYASRFIHKDPRTCYDVKTENYQMGCSGDHLCETDKDWLKTEELKVGDRVVTRTGFESIESITQLEDSDVYDMTVEHENHRYWGGNGISSHNSGKSYLVAKAIADAQKEGYMVVVLDSEQAVSQDYLKKVGVDLDPSMLMTIQVQTVEQTQDMLLEVLNGVKAEQDALGNTKELKLMLIVDSLGMLSSNKAMENAAVGHHAMDMGTKAKALTNMFNQIVQKVGITETVCVMTNHGCQEIGVMFPQMKPKGGQCLVAGTKIKTNKGMKNIENIEIGDMVKTHMGRFKPVERLFNFDNLDVLEVELESGQIIKMTPEHKMLVLRDGQKQWIEAKDLTTEDVFLELLDAVEVMPQSNLMANLEVVPA